MRLTRIIGALALAAGAALAVLPSDALAGDGPRGRGWGPPHGHWHGGPPPGRGWNRPPPRPVYVAPRPYYYAPPPRVYYAPPPRVYYAPPPPVYYAPPPAYYGPPGVSLNFRF